MDVLTLLAIYLKCSPRFNFSSKNKPRCFWYGVCITWILFRINTRWLGFLVLREKLINSLSLLRRNRIKTHFSLVCPVASAKMQGFDDNSFDKSLI